MNIAEIAKMAGVSSAAVSRYFNNGYISEAKKEAIRKVVEDTGYSPSVQAQTLRTKKTRMIGVIMPRIASSAMGRVMEGLLPVLERNGYQTILAVTQNDPRREIEYLETFQSRQVDGIVLIATIFLPEHLEMLKKLTVPVVLVGQELEGYDCVYHDDYHAMYDMTMSALKSGRRRPGYIGVLHEDAAAGTGRWKGFCDALTDGGLQVREEDIITADFCFEDGYRKTKTLWERSKGELDAVICATDEIAAGAVLYLREQDIPVPDRVLVTGAGDSSISRFAGRAMRSIHFSYEKSGEIAAHTLLEKLQQKEEHVVRRKLGYALTD